MPFKHDAIVGPRNEFYPVDPNQIVIQKDWNVREIFDLEDLISSIVENGVRNPIHVKKLKNSSDLILIDGERRLRAVLEANKRGADIKSIPTIIHKKPLNEADELLIQFVANDGKRFTPVEEAKLFQRFINWGWTQTEVAKKVGRSQAHVSERLKLIDLSPAGQQALIAKDITVQQAKQIAKDPSMEGQQKAVASAKARNNTKNQTKKRPTRTKDGREIIYLTAHSECDINGIAELLEKEFLKPFKDIKQIAHNITEIQTILDAFADKMEGKDVKEKYEFIEQYEVVQPE